MKNLLAFLGLWPQKRCPHGSTSWYICPTCKKEFPEWAPFEGEGPYNPNI